MNDTDKTAEDAALLETDTAEPIEMKRDPDATSEPFTNEPRE